MEGLTKEYLSTFINVINIYKRYSHHHFLCSFIKNCWNSLNVTHYSKRQIFVQKFNFDKTLHFFSGNQNCQHLKIPNIFTQFFDNFLTIFLVKSKLSTAKKYKTAAFSRVFQPKQFDNFSREIKVEFLDKK